MIQETCVMNCTDKFLKHSERVGARFAEQNAGARLFCPLCYFASIHVLSSRCHERPATKVLIRARYTLISLSINAIGYLMTLNIMTGSTLVIPIHNQRKQSPRQVCLVPLWKFYIWVAMKWRHARCFVLFSLLPRWSNRWARVQACHEYVYAR